MGRGSGRDNARRRCSSNLICTGARGLCILDRMIGRSVCAYDRTWIRTAERVGIFDCVDRPLPCIRLIALSIDPFVNANADMSRIETVMARRLGDRSGEGKGGSDEDKKRSSEEAHGECVAKIRWF